MANHHSMSKYSKEVIFVYLGGKLPKYAQSSLRLASHYCGLKVRLIAEGLNSILVKNYPQIEFTAVEDFYNMDNFSAVQDKLLGSSTFRGGFWLKVIERFFVLEQYMSKSGDKSVLHAELDQLLFRLDKLLEELSDSEEKGIFLPILNSNTVVASVLFCNDLAALKSLNSFATNDSFYFTDMDLLAKWGKAHPKQIIELPTLNYLINGSEFKSSNKVPAVAKTHGILDDALIGQYVGGVDPRNLKLSQAPKNHWVHNFKINNLSPRVLSNLVLEIDPNTFDLTCSSKDIGRRQLYNLHLHSKLHNQLLKPTFGVERLLELSNISTPTTLPGTVWLKYLGVLERCRTLIRLGPLAALRRARHEINKLLKRRPSSYPFVSGDSFRKLADVIYEPGRTNFNQLELSKTSIIFCSSNLLESFVREHISPLNGNFTILSGNSDANFTLDALVRITSLAPRAKFFVQNIQDSYESVHFLPIGLENRWYSEHGEKLPFVLRRHFLPEKKQYRILSCFSVRTNPLVRLETRNVVSKLPLVDHFGPVSSSHHRSLLSKYAFVISPPGNGVDCHRTWEAFYLHSIPIVLRSAITEYYLDIGLPVWIVDNYVEVGTLDEVALRDKYEEMKSRFESPALWMDYWISRIGTEKTYDS